MNELLPSVLRAALEGAGLDEGVLGSAVERAGQSVTASGLGMCV